MPGCTGTSTPSARTGCVPGSVLTPAQDPARDGRVQLDAARLPRHGRELLVDVLSPEVRPRLPVALLPLREEAHPAAPGADDAMGADPVVDGDRRCAGAVALLAGVPDGDPVRRGEWGRTWVERTAGGRFRAAQDGEEPVALHHFTWCTAVPGVRAGRSPRGTLAA